MHTEAIRNNLAPMDEIFSKNALRLLLAADGFQARLAGEFSAVHGISVNEFLLLLHLESAAKHRLPRGELAKRMHVSASTITRMVAPMEKIGLVERHADLRDARLAFVVLAEAGRDRLTEARATFAKQAGYLFDDRWDPAEIETLASLLHRFIAGSSTASSPAPRRT